jgi:uncharacterized cupredoxin-like copper-binding protein
MKSTSRIAILAVVALILAALILTACGGSGAPTKITVSMDDIKFGESSWEAAAGKQVTADLTNNGKLEHSFVILKKGQDVTGPWQDSNKDKVLFEVKLAAGESKSASFTVPEAGDYIVVCNIPGHVEAGMKGKLTAK